MLPLYPPEYPDRPDAPLLSLGPAFSEEIARSVVCAIWHDNPDQPHETDVRTAAGLTMLEAFHPRDQLETMFAAQGVAVHCAIMDNFRCAADTNTPPLLAIRFRANAVAMNRMFCTNLRELTLLQSRPLPPRPGQPPAQPAGDPPAGPTSGSKTSRAKPAQPAAEPSRPLPEPLVPLEDLPEIPEDVVTRPDGSPGNLTAYTPKAPVVPYVPREPPIMVALATRPKPWRQVNTPKDQVPTEPEADTAVPEPAAQEPDGRRAVASSAADAPPEPTPQEPEHRVPRGPVDLRERIFTGDALARFAATRLDPDAPVEPMQFDSDAAIVELELISTGGDPAAEAHLAAMKAAHPEGKPIVTFRFGTDRPLQSRKDDPTPDG